jgi:ATP synthase subunit 6
MNLFSFLYSPLEQFEILPLFVFNLGFLDLSITNQTVLLALILFLVSVIFFSLLNEKDSSISVVPNRWQSIIEFIYSLILSMVTDNVGGKRSQYFFPLIFSIFFFIVCMNLIGLIPYSFTVTSHFIVTFALSLTVFIGINIICVKVHKLEFFSLFLPAGTSVILAFLLVPVELILYLFRPLSLAIRLFCNMMAGHTLLKIFAGFAWSLMSFSGVLFFMQYLPLITLLPLFGLEFGVALIQAFVFSLLTCIYLNDALNLH